jgi:ferredoxin--NADP+ reductase
MNSSAISSGQGHPTVTREPFRNQGRISAQINNGTFPQNLGLPDLNPETDRVMLCGSPAMLSELKERLKARLQGRQHHHARRLRH